jgi:hypothetical protein
MYLILHSNQILLEIHVSSVAHAMRGLQKKHGSPIESQVWISNRISKLNNCQRFQAEHFLVGFVGLSILEEQLQRQRLNLKI